MTYAAPIWWDTSAAVMESYRVFECKCLRACIGAYRSSESNFRKYISNENIDNITDNPRIDCHIIRLIRDYFSNIPNIENESIRGMVDYSEADLAEDNNLELLPPQAFIPLDKTGYIQDANNVPVIFHWKRHKAHKKIDFAHAEADMRRFDLSYSTALPVRDRLDPHRLSDKYFWLTEKSKHRKELRRRLSNQ